MNLNTMGAQSRVPATADSGIFTRLQPLPNSYTSDISLRRMLGCKLALGVLTMFFFSNAKNDRVSSAADFEHG